ncbi:hypothetical protein niasHT_023152 [Heterodera trifolii]|uniref:Sushi domain-containing protein n=1 Tax=Heterodera trifolii TaxID=157864 RepID=A0ABD2JDV0_9BILA
MLLNYCTIIAIWLRYSTCAETEHRWREKRQAITSGGTTLSPFSSVGSCPPLTAQNGIVNYLPIGTAQNSLIGAAQPAGTTALLTCSVGFFPLGASSAQCLSNSQWSTPIGTCQPLSSPVTGATPFPQTSTLPGMNVIGSGLTTVSSSTVGNCLPMLAPLGGQLTYSTAPQQQQQSILGGSGTYSQGTVVQLFCTNGGAVSGGASQAVCQLGQWQPFSLGQCLGSLGLPGGITPSPQQQTGIGIGTTPFGTTPFGTTSTGTNLGAAIGCLPAVTTAAFGTVQYSQQPLSSSPQGSPLVIGATNYPSGTIATLQCQQGLPSGAQSSVCSNGIWTPPLGMCTGGTTPIGGIQQLGNTAQQSNSVGSCFFGLMTPLGASIQYSSGSTVGPFPSGTLAQVICQQGSPQGQSSSMCTNGQWQPPLLPGCSAQSGGLSNGINSGIGAINSGTNTVSGGLNLLGIGTQCLLGMAPVLGGNIVYSSVGPPYAQGTTANLQCANGQLPTTTTQSGLTTSTIGGIGSIGSIGSPSSTTTATCIGGQWQPAQFGGGVGQCTGGSTMATRAAGDPIAPSIVTLGQTTFSSSTPGFGTTPLLPSQQQQQQCVLGIGGLAFNGRIQYSNGALFGPYPPGTTATLTCNSGFVPSGQTVASCQNGQFLPAVLGQCVQSSADATPYTMPSATTTTTRRSSNSSTTVASSTTTSSNSNNGMGTTANATAATFAINGTGVDTRDCFELPQPMNGRFVYSPMGLGSPYPIGATVTLVCANGTQLSDGSSVGRSAVCHSGGWAMLTLLNGTCLSSSTAAAAADGDNNGQTTRNFASK